MRVDREWARFPATHGRPPELEPLRVISKEGARNFGRYFVPTTLGQQDQLGTIDPGKVADLILHDANPLDRIANTRVIAKVFHGGIAVEPAKIPMPIPQE